LSVLYSHDNRWLILSSCYQIWCYVDVRNFQQATITTFNVLNFIWYLIGYGILIIYMVIVTGLM
jgi:hypothetical protein